ncbi:MAG: xylulokinase [Candidatus Limnocylindrales bacterium]
MSASLVLGLDVSTTATKAILLDRDGTVLATAAAEYPFETPRPLWAEQDPALWWDAAQTTIRQVLAEAGVTGDDVAAVGAGGQMHGMVLLDEADEVVRPAILWNDGRTAAQSDAIREAVGRERLIEITGNDALTSYTATKLLWVRDQEPEHWARARHLLLPKDYVRFRLTGEHALDVNDGAGTLLFDIRTRTWSPEVVEAIGLDLSMLPRTVEGPEVVGAVTAQAAAATGLRAGTPVVGGSGDQAANAVGLGAVVPGIAAMSVGTSGVVFVPTSSPAFEKDGRLSAFCHAVPGTWHFMGVTLSAAGSLKWLRDELAPQAGWDELTALAAGVPPGAEGLIFLPYLSGERTPYADPLARGAFIGLTVRHRLGHVVRAVLEGVAFSLRDVFELVSATAPEPLRELRASGGGTNSALWRQIIADVLAAPIVRTRTAEGVATGGAILAAVAAGWFESVGDACEAMVALTDTTEPGDEAGAYDRAYAVYRSLYPKLQDTFAQLAEV